MKVQRINKYLELEEIPRMIEMFLENGEAKTYPRNSFFLREGQKCGKIGYVHQGGFRHLVEASDGRDRIAGYSLTGDFVTAFPAFDSEASAVSIQAIRESTVYLLDKEYVYSRQTWEYRCRLAEVSMSDVYGRLLLMHRGTPEERYIGLVSHVPSILNEVPLREIASFLRMTPETLSRIRKKMLHK